MKCHNILLVVFLEFKNKIKLIFSIRYCRLDNFIFSQVRNNCYLNVLIKARSEKISLLNN